MTRSLPEQPDVILNALILTNGEVYFNLKRFLGNDVPDVYDLRVEGKLVKVIEDIEYSERLYLVIDTGVKMILNCIYKEKLCNVKDDFLKEAKQLNVACIQYRISNESYLVIQKDRNHVALFRQRRGEE